MALLNDPTRGQVTQVPSIFEQQRQKQQQQQLAQLQQQNIQSQIGLRTAQTKAAGAPSELTKTKLIGLLGQKVVSGQASEQEIKVFEQLLKPTQQQTFNLFPGGVAKTAKEDAKIAGAFQAEADRQNAANPDAPTRTIVKTTAKGQRFIATEPKAPPSAGERIDIADALTSVDALNNLGTLFDTEFVGPIKGRVGSVKDAIGLNPQLQSEFLAATSAFVNAIIKQITGAQMSEPEAKRIKKQIPMPTDPPTVWKAKRNQSLKNIAFMKKRRLQILKESGLRTPKAETGLTPAEEAELRFLESLEGKQ